MKKPAILLAALVACGSMLVLTRKDEVRETGAVRGKVPDVVQAAAPAARPTGGSRVAREEAAGRSRQNEVDRSVDGRVSDASVAEESVASVVTLPNGRKMRVLKRPGSLAKANAADEDETSAPMEMPPAIRLSEDFKLPAVVMALSEGALAERSPQVRQAAENVENLFYRELAEELAKEGGWQEKLVTDPETGEPTLVVEQSPATERVRSRANERFRLLFGDIKYNAYSLRTAVERMSTAKGGSGH